MSNRDRLLEDSHLLFEIVEELKEDGKEFFIRIEKDGTRIDVHDGPSVRCYEGKTLRSALIDTINNETNGSVYIPEDEE